MAETYELTGYADGGAVKSALDKAGTALQAVDVVNALDSTSTTAPLSAAQGKALNDGKAATNADAADFTSGTAADGYVLTADGSGGAAWEAPSGGTGGGERRYAFAEPYIYLGTAPAGTAEAATTWTLTRLTVDAEGVVTATESATDAWDNRVTATYS